MHPTEISPVHTQHVLNVPVDGGIGIPFDLAADNHNVTMNAGLGAELDTSHYGDDVAIDLAIDVNAAHNGNGRFANFPTSNSRAADYRDDSITDLAGTRCRAEYRDHTVGTLAGQKLGLATDRYNVIAVGVMMMLVVVLPGASFVIIERGCLTFSAGCSSLGGDCRSLRGRRSVLRTSSGQDEAAHQQCRPTTQ